MTGASKVGNQLCLTRCDKVLVTRVGYFNGQMQISNLRHDLLHRQGLRSLRQNICTHTKSEFGFNDVHDVATHGNCSAIGQAT